MFLAQVFPLIHQQYLEHIFLPEQLQHF